MLKLHHNASAQLCTIVHRHNIAAMSTIYPKAIQQKAGGGNKSGGVGMLAQRSHLLCQHPWKC